MEQFFLGGLAGAFMLTAKVFISLGVSEGFGGPAQAIMSLNSVWMAILTVLINDQELTLLQLLGLIVGLSGGFIIAFGDNAW